jgi:phenylpyruvate tautomerase PptA (4-oxalocrotonate tautomerase family)
MMNEQTQKLAERIALLLQESETAKPQDDLSALHSTLEKINQRLDKIEAQLTAENYNPKPQILNPVSFHPSQEKFAIAEAVAQEIIEHLNMEKACTFEPNGKPCDHCSMCNSRGF